MGRDDSRASRDERERSQPARCRGLLSVALLGATLLVGPGTAGAEVPVVMLASAGHDEEAARAAQVVASYLAELAVRVEVRFVEPLPSAYDADRAAVAAADVAGEVLAVFWVHHDDGATWLTLMTPGDGRVLVRALPAGASAIDAVGLILQGVVPRLLDGAAIGVSTDGGGAEGQASAAARRTPAARTVAVQERPPPLLWLRLGYAATGFADEALVNHALDVGLELHLAARWSFMARYAVAANLEREAQGVLLTLVRHPVSLGATCRFAVGRLELGPQLWLELDLTTASVHLLQPDVNARRASSARVQLTPALMIGAPITRQVRWVSEVGVSIPLNPADHVVPEAGGPMLSEWPARPVAMVGLQLAMD